jgi:DNA replication protein DnaC
MVNLTLLSGGTAPQLWPSIEEVHTTRRLVQEARQAQQRQTTLSAEQLAALARWDGGWSRYSCAFFSSVPWGPLWDATLAGPIETKAIMAARHYMQTGVATGHCLVLCGPTGVGKTWAGVAALLDDPEDRERSRYFFHTPSLGRVLGFHSERDAMRDCALESDLVLLDDLGAEYRKRDGSGLLDALVEEIVWERETSRLPTIITTNLPPAQFGAEVGDRLADRVLGEWGRVVELPGQSLRRRRVAG